LCKLTSLGFNRAKAISGKDLAMLESACSDGPPGM
jgi:hypothetical protein